MRGDAHLEVVGTGLGAEVIVDRLAKHSFVSVVPRLGWRPLFWGLAACILVSMALISWTVPRWETAAPSTGNTSVGYRAVWANPYFRRMTPIGFFSYGGMIAIQTLWAGPWMVRVGGASPAEAANGLFWINVTMLCTFWSWGLINPALSRRGITTDRLIAWGLPLSFMALAMILIAGNEAGARAWALFCASSTFVSLAQPAVGLAFPPALAGRALSAYNLVIFSGVFVVQWGIGLLIDGFVAMGLSVPDAYRAAMGGLLGCSVASYAVFIAPRRDNPVTPDDRP